MTRWTGNSHQNSKRLALDQHCSLSRPFFSCAMDPSKMSPPFGHMGKMVFPETWFHSSSDLVSANEEMAFLLTTRANSHFQDSPWLWWTSPLAQELTWIQCYLSPEVLKCINTASTNLCNILKVIFIEKPNIFLRKITFQEQTTTFNYTNKAHNYNCCLLYLLGKKRKLGQTIFILLFIFTDLSLKAIRSGADYPISARHPRGPSMLFLSSMCYYLVLSTFKEKGNVVSLHQSVSGAYHLPWHVVAAQ